MEIRTRGQDTYLHISSISISPLLHIFARGCNKGDTGIGGDLEIRNSGEDKRIYLLISSISISPLLHIFARGCNKRGYGDRRRFGDKKFRGRQKNLSPYLLNLHIPLVTHFRAREDFCLRRQPKAESGNGWGIL